MLKEAFLLWKKEQNKKGTTLHRRLVLFFVSISVSIILGFALLLILFGITGKDEEVVQSYVYTELSDISNKINEDFGRVSVGGISVAEDLIRHSDIFFSDHKISAYELKDYPQLIEPLLGEYMQTLTSTINNRYCGGVFVILDATINPDAENAEMSKAGIFLKKTQPTATGNIGVKTHYLRGPARIARDNEIMLLGQWKMEFDISNQEFFTTVIETAKKYPDLPLSRLYYWSNRVTLKGNSESGFLLCIPLRSEDGTIFGLCGIEISDRLFKSFYSPNNSNYENVFTVMAPTQNNNLLTSSGLIAGNYHLTGTRWEDDLILTESHDGFVHYSKGDEFYAGRCTSLHLYPDGSPYANNQWSIALLMPHDVLHTAVQGNNNYFIYIVITLLVLSFIVSYIISHRYLRPVTEAFESIRNTPHDERKSVPYLEINDLFDFLAEKDREHEETIREKERDNKKMQDEVEKAQLEISRLAYSRKQEVDPDLYKAFLEHLHKLTPTERQIFDLYISGKHAKEIMDIMSIKENTLKYHNKNIYSKLGVTSRKELLRFAALMNEENRDQ